MTGQLDEGSKKSMNYDEMPAGPEMDFLIATKFLGQEIPEESEELAVKAGACAEGWVKADEYRWETLELPCHGEWRTVVWPRPYSVKMFLLTELLRELVSDEYEVGVMVCFDGSVECDIWRNGAYLVGGYVESLDEIPLAVCRAVLNLKDL